MRAGLLVLSALVLAGCDEDPLSGTPPGGFRLNLDAAVRDASAPRDAGVPDARLRPDAADPDAGALSPDASLPDAAEPECSCPMARGACTAPAAGAPVFGPGDPLLAQVADLVGCAETSLRLAMYEVSWDCFAGLLRAQLDQKPALQVEVVIDDDQCPRVNGVLSCSLGQLEGHPRVRVIDDMRSRYMHHKLVLVDGRWAWVSSANLSHSSFCSEHNHGLVVEEPAIVQAYAAEFERMFLGRDFGPTDPRPPATGGAYALYFSPETPVTSPSTWFTELVARVRTASSSVDFLIFALTRAEVSEALAEAHARGVRVRGVVDSSYRSEPVVVDLVMRGVPVRFATVHDKLLVVDGRRVATGSPNWSANAWANDENSLWIDDPALAQPFLLEVDRVYAGALPP